MTKRRRTVVTLTEREIVVETRASQGVCGACGAPVQSAASPAPCLVDEQPEPAKPHTLINAITLKGTE
jgi:hypothetical protein